MSMQANLEEHLALFGKLGTLETAVEQAAALMCRTLAGDHKLLFCGNGGSASDSQHFAAEFTGRFINDRRPLAALSLTTDTSALTSIANDYDFGYVFQRQVMALGRPGDCLIAISTSGNSVNVVRAADAARAAGLSSIGLLGRDGGKLLAVVDVPIVVPSHTTARIQEAHGFIGHILCGLVEQALRLA